MKKMVIFVTCILSAAMTMTCLAAGLNPADRTREIYTETETAAANVFPADASDLTDSETETVTAETPAPESSYNAAVGEWYLLARDNFGVKLNTYTKYFIFPDGTVTDEHNSFAFQAAFSDDGSLTIDTSSLEETKDFTVTGKIAPASEEDMQQYEIKEDLSFINYSSNQMILTISYPDPSNPLATTEAVTTGYFLRTSSQIDFLQKFMYGKTWKIEDHTLVIDTDGHLNLDNSASTGKASMKNVNDPSLYMPAHISFRWDNGGTVTYLPVLIDESVIHLQNIDIPEEILILEDISPAGQTEGETPTETADTEPAEGTETPTDTRR